MMIWCIAAILFVGEVFMIVIALHSVEKKRKAQFNCTQSMEFGAFSLTLNERITHSASCALLLTLVLYLFYRSLNLMLLALPWALLYPEIIRLDILAQRKRELNIQFKDLLYAISSSLSAGKSLENSFRTAVEDLRIRYEEDALIVKETRLILTKISMNETVESAVADFARRADIEDIKSFSDVLFICKRTGGNLVQVIKNTTWVMNDKITVRQEIETLLTQRKYEQKLLSAMPLFLIAIVSVCTEDYVKPLYTTWLGRVLMSTALLLLVIAYLIAKKLMDIEV